MPYGQQYGVGYGGGGNYGLAGGMAEGLNNAMRMVQEYNQAQREAQLTRWAQDPTNPENILRSAQAKDTLAQAGQRGTISVGQMAAMAGYTLPHGVNPNAQIPTSDAPGFIEKMAALKGGSNAALGARGLMGGQGAPGMGGGPAVPMLPTDLSAKDMDDVKAIGQGLTNLKQVEQQYKATDAGSHGVAGMISHLPIVGSNPYFQNANPNLAAYNQSIHEAANSYARATFGRVSNELVDQSQALMPQAGTDPALAAQKLNELSNTLHGKAQSIIQEKVAMGRPDQAQALQAHFDNLFSNMRFFPELDAGKQPAAPGPGQITTNFQENPPASGQAQASPASPQQAPAPTAPASGIDPARLAQLSALHANFLKSQQAAPTPAPAAAP